MADEAEAPIQVPHYYVDGKAADDPKLTFREERKLRDLIRELREDPEADIADASVNEFGLALNVVVKQRDDDDYGLEQAFDLPIDQVVKWQELKEKKPARPRQGARRPKS